MVVNSYEKADIKVFSSCPNLVDFVTVRKTFCHWLRVSLRKETMVERKKVSRYFVVGCRFEIF